MNFGKIGFAVVACSLLIVSSCGDKKKTEPAVGSEYLRPATMQYSKQDTSEINNKVNRYVELIQNRNFADAADMLYTVRNDSLLPFTAEEKTGFVKAYSHFPVYNTAVTALILRSDKNNQVDVCLQIMKDGDIATGKGITVMSLNPVVKDGKWYLTLLSKDAEGVKDVYDPNVNNY